MCSKALQAHAHNNHHQLMKVVLLVPITMLPHLHIVAMSNVNVIFTHSLDVLTHTTNPLWAGSVGHVGYH